MIVLMLCSTGLWAQDTLQLSLEKSLEIALSENPTIKIAGKEIERQEYVRKETLGNLYPSLAATGSYNYAAKKSTMDFGGQKISFEPTNTVAVVANLSLPLFAPTVYKTLKLNEEQMRAAVEAARASKITLVSEVKKAFYNILLAEQSLGVLRASETNITQTVDQTRSLFEQEMASEYDLLTAQVQLSNLQPTIMQTENSIRVAKQLLKMYLYLPQTTRIALSGSLDELMDEGNRQQAQLHADLSDNSDIRQLEIQENILNQQFKVSRASRYPTLAFVGSAQYMGRNKLSLGGGMPGEGDGTTLPTAAPVTWETFYPVSLGLQASIPIFAGWTRTNREKQIKNNIEQIRLQRDYLHENVDVQAKTALSDIMTARSQMRANEATITQAQRGYDIAKTRYYAGVGTILELNTAELSLTQARLNHSQSMYDYLSAEAEYTRILGKEF